MKFRGIVRARIFVGGFLLIAALLSWGIGVAGGSDAVSSPDNDNHVRLAAAVYQRNIAYATIAMSVLAGILLFPARRPRMPKWDWAIGLLVALLIGTSLYQLFWLGSVI